VDDNFNPFDPQTQARKLLQATSPTVIDQPYQARWPPRRQQAAQAADAFWLFKSP